MQIQVDPGALQRVAPRLESLGRDVEALGAGTLPAVGAAAGAVGDAGVAAAVAALLDGVNGAVQAAVLSLTALGRAVDAAAHDYGARDADVGATMRVRPGPQP